MKGIHTNTISIFNYINSRLPRNNLLRQNWEKPRTEKSNEGHVSKAHSSSLVSINGQKAENERHGHGHRSRPNSLKSGREPPLLQAPKGSNKQPHPIHHHCYHMCHSPKGPHTHYCKQPIKGPSNPKNVESELVRYSEAFSFRSECIISAAQREREGGGEVGGEWAMWEYGVNGEGTLLFCFIKRKYRYCNLKIKRPLLPRRFLLFIFTPLLGRERQVASGGKARKVTCFNGFGFISVKPM